MLAIVMSSLRCITFFILSVSECYGRHALYVGGKARRPGFSRSLFYCLKTMFQVVNNVIDVLSTDGKADGGWLDAACQQAFLV